MKQVKLFQVKVKANDPLGNRFTIPKKEGKGEEHYDCKDNICHVATNWPSRIWSRFKDSVIAVEDVGICYLFEDEDKSEA